MKVIRRVLIVLGIALIGIGIYFLEFAPDTIILKKNSKKNIKYGFNEAHTLIYDVDTASTKVYANANYSDKVLNIYDFNNNLVLNQTGDWGTYELDDKYIYIINMNGTLEKLYDVTGKLLFDNHSIFKVVDYHNDNYYFIKGNKLLNSDLEEIYTFDRDIKSNEGAYVNNNILYIYNSKNNIAIDLINKKLLIENFDSVMDVDSYSVFKKDNKYELYNENKKIKTYDNAEYLVNSYDDSATIQNNILKLTNGNKTEYLVDGEIKSIPEYKAGDKTIDFSLCTKGGKVKKDGKVFIDDCLSDVKVLGNSVVGRNIDTDKTVLYIGGKKFESDKDSYFSVTGDYIIESNINRPLNKVYDKNGNLIGNFDLIYYDGIYIKRADGDYFVDNNLKNISKKYDYIYCNSVNKFCSAKDENGTYALFYKEKKLTDSSYANINPQDKYIVLNDGIFNQIITLKENSNNYKVDKINNSNIDSIDINKIKNDYNLDFEIKDEYKDLFKKYAYIVENNDGIKGYEKYVYDMFQVITDKNVYQYLNEPYFFSNLKKLNFKTDDSIANKGIAGEFGYGECNILLITNATSHTIYHELMHFVDFSINEDNSINIWKCNNKLYDKSELYNLSDEELNTCVDSGNYYAYIDFITEGGAELFTVKYFSKNIYSYDFSVNYLTAMERIYGSEKIEELFFKSNSNYTLLKLFSDSGFTLDQFNEIINDLSYYTYPSRYKDYKPSGRLLDSLIDLYKTNNKDKDWKNDKVFIHVLSIMKKMYYNSYDKSNYKNELDQVLLTEQEYQNFLYSLIKPLSSTEMLSFRVTPINPFKDGNNYYLSGIIKFKNEIPNGTCDYVALFKYDFDNNKIIDFEYPICK